MILAIDQGTTGTTCLVFDAEGRIAGRGYSEFDQYFPRPGWIEHDATEIWEVTRRVAARGDRLSRIEGAELDGVGITNQRDRGRLGPGERRAAAPGAGLAGPADGRARRRARPARRRWFASGPG
ncbi:MAG: FGGY family carbohydrate kinase [Solirubrobacterales bacterium]